MHLINVTMHCWMYLLFPLSILQSHFHSDMGMDRIQSIAIFVWPPDARSDAYHQEQITNAFEIYFST